MPVRLYEEPCELCEKYFLQNPCLIAHISLSFRPCSKQRILFWPEFRKELRRTGNKEYLLWIECDTCNKQFKQNRRMKKHIQECDGNL